MQEGKQNEGLKLEFLVSSESDVRHCDLLAPGPFCPSGPRCLGHATRSLDPELCRRKASGKNKPASWKLAVQEGKQNEGLKLVSSQFRKRRLALCAACSGPVLSFRARVFGPCDRVL